MTIVIIHPLAAAFVVIRVQVIRNAGVKLVFLVLKIERQRKYRQHECAPHQHHDIDNRIVDIAVRPIKAEDVVIQDESEHGDRSCRQCIPICKIHQELLVVHVDDEGIQYHDTDQGIDEHRDDVPKELLSHKGPK